MEDVVTTILVPAIVTLVATVLAGMLLDYVRNARARITYFVTAAIPIPVSGKTIGAYLVGLANTSKQTIKDVSCHVQASPAVVRNGGIETSQGLQYTVTERGHLFLRALPVLLTERVERQRLQTEAPGSADDATHGA